LTILDSKQYKETERQSWNIAAAGCQKWWKTIERGTEIVSRQLIALAEIKLGSIILDIATGIGEPCITGANQMATY
jgi:ubiquinone/menaquinone biosynthesis C-methylase UbiE